MDQTAWLPDFDTHAVEETGRDWPATVIVTKWETNDIGERRFVETRDYHDAAECAAHRERGK